MLNFNTRKILIFYALIIQSCSCSIFNNSKEHTRFFKMHYPTAKQIKLNVVHIQQNDTYSCATTSVAMILSYYLGRNKQPLDKDDIWRLSKSSIDDIHQYGNDMDGLKNIAAYYGFKSEFLKNLTTLKLEQLLSQGVPVMINVQVHSSQPFTHAFLLTGYDKKEQLFFVNDPAKRARVISYAKLKKVWQAFLSKPRGMSYQSGFIIYPKIGAE